MAPGPRDFVGCAPPRLHGRLGPSASSPVTPLDFAVQIRPAGVYRWRMLRRSYSALPGRFPAALPATTVGFPQPEKELTTFWSCDVSPVKKKGSLKILSV